ncbi:hypothetical protein CABS03_05565 [Colletotrichum abscissum]|uniref:Uncharacterized protein n=1 Tax=Colletotrichum abscissum TaxID=1671311 RepID=A0A9P9XE16_9PEZI|nr:hypothetical protein CABS02_07609 [Colletotrichum abscissum]
MQAFHNRSVLVSAPSVSNVYLWGGSDYSTTDVESLQAWKCRYSSWERIMVSVEMVSANGKLVLDNTNPPRPDRSTSTPWKDHIPVPFLDPQTDGLEAESCGSAFPEVARTQGLVSYFNASNILIAPYGQVPLEAFGDPQQSWKILEALKYNCALLSAQILNIENRLRVEEMQNEELEPLSAVLMNNNAKRLVQNPTTTYLLVGILSFVGIIHIFMLFSSALRRFTRWRKGLLDMDVQGLATSGFSSIAMMAALLDSSDFAKHNPEDSYNKETVGDENLGREEMNRRDGDNTDEDSQDMDSEDALEGEERSEFEGIGRPVFTA